MPVSGSQAGTRTPDGDVVAAPVPALFDAVAAATPDAVAVAAVDGDLTYAELAARVHRLARVLGGRGVGRGTVVAVAVERSPDLVVALLAVLASGAAYVPLDPAYPAQRLDLMLTETAPVLLVRSAGVTLPVAGAIPDLVLDDAGTVRACAAADPAAPVPGPGVDDPMYVTYTSGSTGRPKGVVVPHRGVTGIVATQAEVLGVGPGDRVLQWASVSFDAAFWDLALGLLSGATLVVMGQDDLLPGEPLAATLRRMRVTVATLPPSALAATEPAPDLLPGGIVVSTGDACGADIVRRWGPGRRVFNGYGPTETTVGATLAGPLRGGGTQPIGRAFLGTTVHVVDDDLRAVPDGEVGQLCVAGPGLADGYLGRPRLTADRFRPDPFGPPGGRMYLTGDLGRRDGEGTLWFIGRRDRQVKVRGFRIELDEVESVLATHPAVRHAAVEARPDRHGDLELVGYAVPGPTALEPAALRADLRAHLAARLAPHMVPGRWALLDALPVGPTGKVDRAALPGIGGTDAERTGGAAPRTPTEAMVCARYAEVLGTDGVGVDDGFFELGGHSLLAVRLVSALRAELGVDVPMRAAFTAPTPAQLAALLDTLVGSGSG